MLNFILSSCGTSLLTNHAGGDVALLRKHANAKRNEDVPESDRRRIELMIGAAEASLKNAGFATVGKLSAELNALSKFYEKSDGSQKSDHHVLICTDTWVGNSAARLLVEWLRTQGLNAVCEQRQDLQTRDLDAFRIALSDLVEWCETTIPGYRERGYRVVFNLTGGFKSINGFLQALAMVYADEAIYVFESEDDLLRLPRLPLQISQSDVVRRYLTTFRRLASKLPVDSVDGIAETLLWQIGGDVALSPWGQLLWEQNKKSMYGEQLYSSPSSKLRFGDRFERTVCDLPAERLKLVNERVDDLVVHLETGGANLKRLDLKRLAGGPKMDSTHECDAWADLDARRLFGHFEGEVFVLDKLDKALH